MYESMRRLQPRGPVSTGITVDADGATLGPDCVLVNRTVHGYRCVDRGEAAALQEFLFADGTEPDWLFRQCRRIANALADQEIALAQILGLHIPIAALDPEQLRRLARAAPFLKANFNPDEPRIPAGEPGGGEWTTGAGDEGEAAVLPMGNHDGPASSPMDADTELLLIPAQLTIPWDFPIDTPWETPGTPSEITPIPFDFPGAERRRPPIPTNPYPNDPECAEEWAAAYDFCDKAKKEGKFKSGYAGPGKDMRSCLLGQVSQRCGGNPTA